MNRSLPTCATKSASTSLRNILRIEQKAVRAVVRSCRVQEGGAAGTGFGYGGGKGKGRYLLNILQSELSWSTTSSSCSDEQVKVRSWGQDGAVEGACGPNCQNRTLSSNSGSLVSTSPITPPPVTAGSGSNLTQSGSVLL